MLTEGFENQPYTDMVWGAPHLPRLLEACGYRPVFPMSTFEFDVGAKTADALLGDKQRAVLSDPDWTWKPISRSAFKARFEEARQCLNDGFSDNPMFVPLTSAEFDFQAGEMMWIVDPRIALRRALQGRARRGGDLHPGSEPVPEGDARPDRGR